MLGDRFKWVCVFSPTAGSFGFGATFRDGSGGFRAVARLRIPPGRVLLISLSSLRLESGKAAGPERGHIAQRVLVKLNHNKSEDLYPPQPQVGAASRPFDRGHGFWVDHFNTRFSLFVTKKGVATLFANLPSPPTASHLELCKYGLNKALSGSESGETGDLVTNTGKWLDQERFHSVLLAPPDDSKPLSGWLASSWETYAPLLLGWDLLCKKQQPRAHCRGR